MFTLKWFFVMVGKDKNFGLFAIKYRIYFVKIIAILIFVE